MKAEESKELAENPTAQWLLKTWGNLKAGSGYGTILIIALVLVAFFGWSFFANLSANNRSKLWYNLDTATTDKDLQAIVEENGDSLQAKIAQIYEARIQLGANGLDQLGISDEKQRAEAFDSIARARDTYARLAPELSASPVLQSEAYRSAAIAEESLIGVIKPDTTTERGSIDQAIQYYEKAALVLPKQELSVAAGKRAQELKEKKDDIVAFYRKVNKDILDKKYATPAQSPPGIPPGLTLPPGMTLPPGLIPGM